MKKVAKLTIFI